MRAISEFPSEDIGLYFNGTLLRHTCDTDHLYFMDDFNSMRGEASCTRYNAVTGRRDHRIVCASELQQYWPRFGLHNIVVDDKLIAVQIENVARRISRRSACPDYINTHIFGMRDGCGTGRILAHTVSIDRPRRYMTRDDIEKWLLDNPGKRMVSAAIHPAVVLQDGNLYVNGRMSARLDSDLPERYKATGVSARQRKILNSAIERYFQCEQ